MTQEPTLDDLIAEEARLIAIARQAQTALVQAEGIANSARSDARNAGFKVSRKVRQMQLIAQGLDPNLSIDDAY